MNPQIFREYDIRGIVDKDFSIPETYDLTKAIISYFLTQKPDLKTVSVGMDARIHSPAIAQNVTQALTDCGLNVIDIGLCPSPLMYFSLFTLDCQAGLMITASHNPKEYNGIKICLDKRSVWGKEIQTIRTILESKSFCPTTTTKGSVTTYPIIDDYLDWVTKHFQHLKNFDIAVAIDCGNGTAGTVLPPLIQQMGWRNVQLLYEKVDGTFPNHEADPINPDNMRDLASVLKRDPSLWFGIGFDGDCDRMAPITKSGEIILGDRVLGIFAQQVLKNHPGAAIVYDIKSSSGLIEFLKAKGARGFISPSGHAIVKEEMLKHDALLAGELSCHFFFNDRYFGYDDAIYAMIRLFEIMHETSQSLSELLAPIPQKVSSPEYRIPCKEEEKSAIVEDVKTYFATQTTAELITIDGVRAQFNYGWGIVRKSNTQPMITVRFEAETAKDLRTITETFIKALKAHFPEKTLQALLT